MSAFARVAVLSVFVLGVIAILGAARGQGAAVVDPSSARYRVETGRTVEGSFRLTNPGGDPLALRLYLSDWGFDAVGNFTFAEVGTRSRSASEWLSLQATVVEIAPRSSVVVPYVFTVPPDAPPGTHWSVVFAESQPLDPEPGQTAARISVRVGHILYLDVPPLEPRGAITGIFGQPPATAQGAYQMIVQYRNEGNVAQRLVGSLQVLDGTGQRVIEAEIEPQVVLPESERALQINLTGPLPAGNYTALVVLNYGDDEVEVAGTHDFTLTQDLEEPGGR